MGTLTRLIVLAVSVLSLFGGAAATAGAFAWHNTGSTSFTATTGTPTLTSTSARWECTAAHMTGDAPAATVGATYFIRGTIGYTGCSFAGVSTGVDCNFTLTLTSQSGSQTTGDADMTCRWYQFAAQLCHLAGSLHAVYTNPVSGVGTLTLTTGGNLIAKNPASGSCPLGNGDRVHQSEMTFRTTSANPPILTRTA